MLTGAPEVHIEEQVNAFLLNGKEWEFLSEIRVDENAQSVDHRSVSFHLLAFKYNSCVFFFCVWKTVLISGEVLFSIVASGLQCFFLQVLFTCDSKSFLHAKKYYLSKLTLPITVLFVAE